MRDEQQIKSELERVEKLIDSLGENQSWQYHNLMGHYKGLKFALGYGINKNDK